jgi:hypothetical protein
MLDPITKEKFISTRLEAMKFMKLGHSPESDEINFEKKESYAGYYQNQIDNYDENVRKIFDRTHITPSQESGKQPHNIGNGTYGEEGVVFPDGVMNKKPLTVREKNIIEAHEKGHGLRDFTTEDQQDFKHSIDVNVLIDEEKVTGIRTRGYLMQAMEIAERMAQLKNYFGMTASDEFTIYHLKYAKTHYLNDVGLDNNMTLFFKAITPNSEKKFIETVNRYPL